MGRFERVFGAGRKPVIAMVHLGALPGTPLHDAARGVEGIIADARADLMALQAAGVDAVMFGNENDRPYELKVDTASTATMAYVVGRLRGAMVAVASVWIEMPSPAELASVSRSRSNVPLDRNSSAECSHAYPPGQPRATRLPSSATSLTGMVPLMVRSVAVAPAVAGILRVVVMCRTPPRTRR